MTARQYVYFECMGGIWRLSYSAAVRFLKLAATADLWNLDDFGTMVATDPYNITDLKPEDAEALLGELRARRGV